MRKKSLIWMMAAILVFCGTSIFSSCSNDDDPVPQPDLNLPEKIIGKWMVEELDGQACPTNLKAVITFLSPTKAYGSLSDFYSESWNDHSEADVVINRNGVTLTAFEDEHTKHVTVATVSSITDNDMLLKSDWKVFVDDKMVIHEEYDKERYIRITSDYRDAILGTWEGHSTGAEGSEFDDGENHRWEYMADGTFRYYHKVDGQWQLSNDVLHDYFVDGILLCTRWKNAGEGQEENREWWEIESIEDDVMKWTALRMREDGSTYTATFEMTKVPEVQHEAWTRELIDALDQNPEAKGLLVKAIDIAKSINPDHDTNPAQTLDEYYDYLDWSAKCLPWSVIPQPVGRSLYDKIDQSVDYFYFILDMPLDELKDRGLYYPTLQYIEPFASWFPKYHDGWAKFLESEESWKPEYSQVVLTDPMFGLQNGWYEDASNWHSFNDFFARNLSSPDARPIASPEDESVIVSGADAQPQGVWPIDDDGNLIQHEGVLIKSRQFNAVDDLLGPESAFRGQFAGGTLTHTFLDVNDYHHYHFPVSGTIREIRKIQAIDAAGGITIWDAEAQRYRLECDIPGWQMIETRGLVIIETEDYGLVAMLPIGMSQISSVNFDETLKVGDKVKKGDHLGWFLFGGSDIVYLFQKGITFNLATTNHLLQGEKLGTLQQ